MLNGNIKKSLNYYKFIIENKTKNKQNGEF